MSWAFGFLLVIFTGNLVFSREWTQDALRLTGESTEIRSGAIYRLKKKPGLKKMMRSELKGPRRELALDVIAALEWRDFVPELLQFAKKDETGISYLTINALLTSKNVTKIFETYRKRLADPDTFSLAQVIFLDSFGAMGSALNETEIKNLIKSPSFEVRVAVVDYLGAIRKTNKNFQIARLLKLTLEGSPYQLRLRTIYVVDELRTELGKDFQDFYQLCQKDSNAEVRELCNQKLADRS